MIRYRQYGQEVEVWSNAGDGVVDHIDIQRASSDAMSIRNRSFEFVVRIALSDTLFENNAHHIGDPRATAIWELSSKRFDPEKSKELLLKVRERHPEYERHVERALLRIDLRL